MNEGAATTGAEGRSTIGENGNTVADDHDAIVKQREDGCPVSQAQNRPLWVPGDATFGERIRFLNRVLRTAYEKRLCEIAR